MSLTFSNEVREITDKPIVLAGSLSTGRDIVAAQAMGADMAYMGTRFIAAPETLAPPEYREALFAATAKDVYLTAALDGFPANFLAPSIQEAGIELEDLAVVPPGQVYERPEAKTRYKKIWSAGQGVGMVQESVPAADLCNQIIGEYEAARASVVGAFS